MTVQPIQRGPARCPPPSNQVDNNQLIVDALGHKQPSLSFHSVSCLVMSCTCLQLSCPAQRPAVYPLPSCLRDDPPNKLYAPYPTPPFPSPLIPELCPACPVALRYATPATPRHAPPHLATPYLAPPRPASSRRVPLSPAWSTVERVSLGRTAPPAPPLCPASPRGPRPTQPCTLGTKSVPHRSEVDKGTDRPTNVHASFPGQKLLEARHLRASCGISWVAVGL